MKIALLEKNENIDFPKFDRVISFCRDDYTNVDGYVETNELDKISEKVHLEVRKKKNIARPYF